MNGKTAGNLILMTTLCIVIFWMFMALKPAHAQLFGPTIQQKCVAMGYKPGTALYLQCYQTLTAERSARQRRINEAVQNLQNSLQAAQPRPAAPMVMCHSDVYGTICH
jgi:hypothetical protein